jgi:hypothetical protein
MAPIPSYAGGQGDTGAKPLTPDMDTGSRIPEQPQRQPLPWQTGDFSPGWQQANDNMMRRTMGGYPPQGYQPQSFGSGLGDIMSLFGLGTGSGGFQQPYQGPNNMGILDALQGQGVSGFAPQQYPSWGLTNIWDNPFSGWMF